jgi:asparagine synthase (glutamine-hydrolysing)
MVCQITRAVYRETTVVYSGAEHEAALRMCGIAGLFGQAAADGSSMARMIGTLAHRGPDHDAVWTDPEALIALGHRRLAIVDLSPAGNQPMHSADGRFVLTFNGEIYNFEDLRDALEAQRCVAPGGWRGHSDTEVFLEGISAWGLGATLAKSAGMFAFALWDRKERTLSLVRDRFGEKPLYYGWAAQDFVFGSELKAIRSHPRFDNAVDRTALALFAARTHVPAPLSIYRRIFKLQPGCVLRISAEGAKTPLDDAPEEGVRSDGLELTRYWSYRDVLRRGMEDPIDDEADALHQVEQALATSIQGQSFADVPVGAFLSGGIDSSTIVALYQKHSSIPVRTFSIGFAEAGFDEAQQAKAVANHLGTLHHEQYVTAEQARDVIPLLPSMYDEPFADSSQIPTHLVSRFARQQVTVALTGDGGDELFGGYTRHVVAPRMWQQLQRLPRPIRAAGAPLSKMPVRLWSGAAGLVGRGQPHVGGKIQRLLGVAGTATRFDDVYRSLREEWSAGSNPVLGVEEAGLPFDLDVAPDAPDSLRTMYCDAVSYLPNDVLCKVDRASMAVSLETRVPFLDHRLAELAARIPLAMKIREGRGKVILRKLLDRHVPRALVERPKSGFAVPIGEWIKGPLRPWAEDLLDQRAMRAEGWFDAALVHARWRDHLAGKRNSTAALWAVLMFQAWLREQQDASAVAA